MENTATSRFMNMTNIAESGTSSQMSDTGSGISSTILNVLAIVIILALLGINIFYYLGDAADFTATILDPIYSLLGYETSDTVKQTVKTSAKGANIAVDSTSNATKQTIDYVEKIFDETLPTDNTTMSHSKNTTTTNVAQDKLNNRPVVSSNVMASNEDEDIVTINSVTPKTSGSVGYCYIGEDRGHKSCAEINDENLCMSGEVFPTRDLCINPNLRS
jgi:hypothetical protein